MTRPAPWPKIAGLTPARLLTPEELALSPMFEIVSLAVGLVVGSFANVCIHRLPRGQSVVRPPSRCPRCGKLIRFWHNVPVLGWLVLRGRCADCREPISIRYPLVEAANGLLWLALAAALGPVPRALVLMPLVTALLVLALVDLEHQILPDAITLPGVGLGLVATALPGWPVTLRDAAASAVGGYLLLAATAFAAERYYGEEALGQGDWKLVAMLGAFLGARGALVAVFCGTLAGAVAGLLLVALRRGSRRMRLPLGTFLALSGVFTVFAGEAVLALYERFFALRL